MKEFLQNEEVAKILTAKQLLSLIERVVGPRSLVWPGLSDSGAVACRGHQGLASQKHEVKPFCHRPLGIGTAVDDYGESLIPEDSTSGISTTLAGSKAEPE